MAARRKIALIYEYNENWIGGTYYIENLISALNTTPDKEKPELVIITPVQKDYDILLKSVQYPYISNRDFKRKLSLAERAINKLWRILTGKNYLLPVHRDLHVVFPATESKLLPGTNSNLFWIPDFQEHYLPEFFTEKEMKARKAYQSAVVGKANHIVFSSQAAKEDFNEIYPKAKLNQYILPFAVTHKISSSLSDDVAKFALPVKYFICSNQFWVHKNHKVIFNAVKLLKEQGTDVTVVFTGKEHDYRYPDYFNELKEMAEQLDITSNLKFLGFIDRGAQLLIMKDSVAVIQPSLFEGWSTVIEDAKSRGNAIIASDIKIHREQLRSYRANELFKPDDAGALANCMKSALSSTSKPKEEYDYDKDILNFRDKFLSIVSQL